MRLAAWQPPIEHLSASAVSMLISCPEQFRLRRIKKLPESRGIDKFIGAVDHSVHEANYRQKIHTDEDFPLDTMFKLYRKEWDEQISLEGEPEWGVESPQSLHERGQLMVETFHTVVSPQIKPIAVETRFEEKVRDVPIPIVGYADVEETNRLIERKTSKTKVSSPKPQWLLQGRIYNLIFDKPVDWMIVTRQVTPQVITPDYEPALRLIDSDKDVTVRIIQQAAAMLNDFWTRYGPDQPWPTHGILGAWTCNYCGFGPRYGRQCSAWKS